jgi:hypothetical protein
VNFAVAVVSIVEVMTFRVIVLFIIITFLWIIRSFALESHVQFLVFVLIFVSKHQGNFIVI